MPKPTKTNVAKKPMAVIMLAAETADVKVIDRDFEWFETEDAAKAFLAECEKWAADDVAKEGDLLHLFALVTDTTTDPIKVEAVKVFAKSKTVVNRWIAEANKDPNWLLTPEAPKPVKKASTAKPVVKGRSRTNAANAVKPAGATPAAPPARKGAQALKQTLAKKATPANGTAKAASPAKATPTPTRRVKPVAKAETPAPPMGLVVLGRSANGRFVRVGV